MNKFIPTTKHFAICTLFFALLALALHSSRAADASRISFGCTNSIAVSTTITANMGNAIPLGDHTSVGLEVHFAGSEAGTTGVIYSFARANTDTPVAADWETVPLLTAGFAQNGIVAVVGYTNLPVAAIGAARWIKLVSVQNQDADAVLTNHAAYVVLKRGL